MFSKSAKILRKIIFHKKSAKKLADKSCGENPQKMRIWKFLEFADFENITKKNQLTC